MATTDHHTDLARDKEYGPGSTSTADHHGANGAHHRHDGSGTAGTGKGSSHAAFGGELQPGEYRSPAHRKFGNPAPLGLSAFALTTFVLSLVNFSTHGVTKPNIVVAAAFGYGGLVQLLAGMWEMAVGNTFGATALSSFGGFWICIGIVLTPGGFEIASSYKSTAEFEYAFGLFLFGWFIFTFLLLLCTLKSTLAFFLLFFFLDLAFLMLAIAQFILVENEPSPGLKKAGGMFGLLSAFAAWYNALAGMADSSNSFFLVPVVHFPWSDKGRERRSANKSTRETV